MWGTIGRVGALLVIVIAQHPDAIAQPGSAGPPPPGAGPMAGGGPLRDSDGFWPRIGLFGGLVAGFGWASESSWNAVGCEVCADGDPTGGYIGLDIGYRLRRRLAVVGALGVLVHSDFDPVGGDTFDFKELNTGLIGIGAQYWVAPRVSIRGLIGSGLATANVQFLDVDLEDAEARGPGAMLSFDYELWERPSFSIGAQFDLTFYGTEGETLTVVGFGISGRLHSTESMQ